MERILRATEIQHASSVNPVFQLILTLMDSSDGDRGGDDDDGDGDARRMRTMIGQ